MYLIFLKEVINPSKYENVCAQLFPSSFNLFPLQDLQISIFYVQVNSTYDQSICKSDMNNSIVIITVIGKVIESMLSIKPVTPLSA